MNTYHRWIGLPHITGADPDDGVGADCLLMCAKVRRAAGLYTPELDPQWFDMARQGKWVDLWGEWWKRMERCEPKPYALCVYSNRKTFGVGILVDSGVLRVSHDKGVQWVPLALEASRQFWEPRVTAV